jgi:hypothetical protein
MRLILQILGNVVGIVLAVAGLLGSKVPLPALLAWLQNPLVSSAAMLLAVIILAFTWADFIAEHHTAKAGGISKKEFPACLAHWDALNFFEVWHVAYLWAGLEPYDRETQKTRAYPEFRRLKQDLDAGLIPQVEKRDTWLDATLSRQQLIDYAALRRERPKFLFPYMRSIPTRLWQRLFGPEEIDPNEVNRFDWVISWRGRIHQHYGGTWQQVEPRLLKALKEGELEAIGRPLIGELELPYVRIPHSFWESATEHWEWEVPHKGPMYKSVRIKASSQMMLEASQAS